MPSHPDRVRRNYHTVETCIAEKPGDAAWFLQIWITKKEIASWASPRCMMDGLMRQVHDQFTATFTRGK